jgi:RHS repeat-associated protein
MGTSASAVSPVPRHRKQFGWVDAHGTDADNGPLYMRQRWYDPTLQRFISSDPIGLAGGANLYSYCLNSPLNFTDEFGLKGWAPRIGGAGLLNFRSLS